MLCKVCNIQKIDNEFPVIRIYKGKTHYRKICRLCYRKRDLNRIEVNKLNPKWVEKFRKNKIKNYYLNWEQNKQHKREKYRLQHEKYYLECNNTCVYCNQQANTIEHILAVDNGGTWDDYNLVVACKTCNSSKNNKYLLNFLWSKYN